MSAINIHVGTQAPEDRDATLVCDVDGEPLGDGHEMDGARQCLPDLASTHNGLTRTVFIRRTIEDLLAGRSVYIADGDSLGKQAAAQRTALFFVVDPPFTKFDIPWMPMPMESIGTVELFGESSKMKCPTWDLPAGSPIVGGSCPAATAGQSIIPNEVRIRSQSAVGQPVRLQETICQICYAEGGQYQSPHVQMGEMIRYWWCRQVLDGAEATSGSRQAWVDTIVRAVEGTMFPDERPIDPRTGNPVLPIRIHSSGDFYSPAYAEAWIEVCNRLPEVMFWAPTRTWASAGWNRTWERLLPRLQHKNLSLRPSAYHTGDIAPGQREHPWPGDYVYTSEGSTSIYAFDDANAGRPDGATPHSVDPRYDFGCGTYKIVDDAHSCRNALAPDGKIGCRACWIHPELRVNYTTH
jgi:hypothetical protein